MRGDEVRTLFDYSYWATGRVRDAAVGISAAQFCAPAPMPFPFDDLRGTLVHTLDTERNARVRLRGEVQPPSLHVEDFPTPAELTDFWQEEEAHMRAYLAGLSDEDLQQPFDLGPRGTLPVWELLLHFANHSTQHRSEAAILLTYFGHSPGDLDFFLYAITRLDSDR